MMDLAAEGGTESSLLRGEILVTNATKQEINRAQVVKEPIESAEDNLSLVDPV